MKLFLGLFATAYAISDSFLELYTDNLALFTSDIDAAASYAAMLAVGVSQNAGYSLLDALSTSDKTKCAESYNGAIDDLGYADSTYVSSSWINDVNFLYTFHYLDATEYDYFVKGMTACATEVMSTTDKATFTAALTAGKTGLVLYDGTIGMDFTKLVEAYLTAIDVTGLTLTAAEKANYYTMARMEAVRAAYVKMAAAIAGQAQGAFSLTDLNAIDTTWSFSSQTAFDDYVELETLQYMLEQAGEEYSTKIEPNMNAIHEAYGYTGDALTNVNAAGVDFDKDLTELMNDLEESEARYNSSSRFGFASITLLYAVIAKYMF